MAAYVAMEFDGLRTWLIAFYALVGLASLAKGAAGLLPLAIVLVYTIVTDGVSRLTRVVSVPGLVVLVLLAVPWWILAALAGRERFVEGIVFQDQLLWYFGRTGWHWRANTEPVRPAPAITLPLCLRLPLAISAAVRGADLQQR